MSNNKRNIVLIGALSLSRDDGPYEYRTVRNNKIEASISSEASFKALIEDEYNEGDSLKVFYLASESAIQSGSIDNAVKFAKSIAKDNIEINYQECCDNFNKDDISKFINMLSEKIDNNCDVYVDLTAGFRNASLLMLMILRLIQANNMNLKGMLYAKFDRDSSEKNVIIDEYEIYRLFDVISGVDEFIKFGRADRLGEYFENYDNLDPDFDKVVKSIIKLSDSLLICQPNGIIDAIEEINKYSKKYKDKKNEDIFAESIFKILDHKIKNVYGAKGRVDLVKLIKWCNSIKLYQPALALIVEYIPIIAVKTGVVRFKRDAEVDFKDNLSKKDYRSVICAHKSTFERNIPYKKDMKFYWSFEGIIESRNNISHIGESNENVAVIKDKIDKLLSQFDCYEETESVLFALSDKITLYDFKYGNK